MSTPGFTILSDLPLPSSLGSKACSLTTTISPDRTFKKGGPPAKKSTEVFLFGPPNSSNYAGHNLSVLLL